MDYGIDLLLSLSLSTHMVEPTVQLPSTLHRHTSTLKQFHTPQAPADKICLAASGAESVLKL